MANSRPGKNAVIAAPVVVSIPSPCVSTDLDRSDSSGSTTGGADHHADPLIDLNELALTEFRNLLEVDQMLAPTWRQAAKQLVVHGIPKDMALLKELIEGVRDAAAEEAES